MDQDNKKSSEKNNSSMVWFSMILVVAVAIAIFMIMNQTRKRMSFSDFQNLVIATEYDQESGELVDDSEANVTVQEGGKNGRTIRYTKPNRIEVGERRITGWVTMQTIDGPGPDSAGKEVEFVVNKDLSLIHI